MKKIILACVVIMMACAIPNAKVPDGYKSCSADSQCDEGQYCGFKFVDTGAVCLEDHNVVVMVKQ